MAWHKSSYEQTMDDCRKIHETLPPLVALELVFASMEEKEMTRTELARRLGCSRANISRLLNEKMNFKMEMLAKLATAPDRDVEIWVNRKDK